VDVERLCAVRSQRFHYAGPDREVGYEVPVHHVDMDPVGPGFVDCAYFLAEPGEVSRQDGRGNDGHEAD